MANIVNNLTATTDPQVTSDSGSGYAVGSSWFNTATGTVFRCYDATAGAAVWSRQAPGFDPWPSLTFRKPDSVASLTNSTHGTSATLIFLPFVIQKKITVDQMAMYVSATGASAAYRLGLYSQDDTTEQPGALLASAGVIDGSTTTGTRTLTFGTAQTLYPGVYWGAVGFAATATPATVTRVGSSLGRFILGTALGDFAGPNLYRYYQASSFTYASGLPSTAGTVTASNGGDGIVMALRRA